MKERVRKLKRFLEERFPAVQAFNTPNIAGDEMMLVYDEDDITVYWATIWSYVEIFGLTDKEFASVTQELEVVPGYSTIVTVGEKK